MIRSAAALGLCLLLCGAAPAAGSPWWRHASFYQVYPRSFKDSNDDGVGDLQGVVDGLTLLADMGMDAVCLSPVFRSPPGGAAYGAVSNHCDVDPALGSLETVDELVARAHALGLRVVLELAPGYTSDRHPWFRQSVRRVDPFTDFYVWKDAKTDKYGSRKPPNNWLSYSGNSSWTWNEARQQYYYHTFTAHQPDLNYRCQSVMNETKKILKFWMDRGVDGFRCNAVESLVEDELLRDEPKSGNTNDTNDHDYLIHIYTKNQPETFSVIYEWRKFVDSFVKDQGTEEKILILGTCSGINDTNRYYGNDDGSKLGGHFVLNRVLMKVFGNSTAYDIVNLVTTWLNGLKKQHALNWAIGDYDSYRAASRFGVQNVDGFNILVSLLPGIIVTYYGEEIGMENTYVPFEHHQDPYAWNVTTYNDTCRDFARTPYLWNNSTNAGFNAGAKTWLPVGESYLTNNLEDQQLKERSHYKVYRELMKLRKLPILSSRDCTIEAMSDQVLLLRRCHKGDCLANVFNFGETPETLNLSGLIADKNEVVLVSVESSKNVQETIELTQVTIEAHESIVLKYSSF